MLNDYPDILEVKDIQAILRIGRNVAYKLVHTEIKHLKIGKKYLVPKRYLLEYILTKSKVLMDGRNSDIIINIMKEPVTHDNKEAC